MTIYITNTSSVDIKDWTLVLSDADFTIESIWNASLTQEGNRLIITPLNWNSSIAAGDTISFGFQGSGSVNSDFEYYIVN
ncbi:MAG TPA: hypothetical protein GXZ73_06045 [Herbinix luporum]|jgi:cellulase/cellobiase CelA1|nr:hypothetical protein [Herbinix luporum]